MLTPIQTKSLTIEKNITSLENKIAIDKELDELVSTILNKYQQKSKSNVKPILFKLMMKHWRTYCESKADLESVNFIDTPNYQFYHCNSSIETTKIKIQTLKKLYKSI